ncbi:RNA polymerase sigma factor [Jatrophihabitans telluris]|uniref:RNA polymerase sigma factor n=1 Tax=Jatrophihabitans telluris TaxID=2038343 RepID=A0ABY4QYE1_9ACTN|nr:RNA polymerase sigma factor [Jatrophihabitans telluris]UQX88439.1 RNA polymerase sigma factor [Jatrophihabitans telluris]
MGNHEDAEDVTQDSLLAAWRGLSGFEGRSQFSTWLHRIVTNRAINCLRQRERGRSVTVTAQAMADVAGVSAGADTEAQNRGTADALSQAMRSLPDRQRTVVDLHHVHGLSYASIASQTGSTVPAVRSHLFRARRVLAVLMADWA